MTPRHVGGVDDRGLTTARSISWVTASTEKSSVPTSPRVSSTLSTLRTSRSKVASFTVVRERKRLVLPPMGPPTSRPSNRCTRSRYVSLPRRGTGRAGHLLDRQRPCGRVRVDVSDGAHLTGPHDLVLVEQEHRGARDVEQDELLAVLVLARGEREQLLRGCDGGATEPVGRGRTGRW